MNLEEFNFELPKNLIAQTPLENRTSSRLLVMNRSTGEIQHKEEFSNILDLINKGDCIVLNDTKVIPARIFGKRKHTGANIELLLLKRLDNTHWETLVKPAKRVKLGDIIYFGDFENCILECQVKEILDDGGRIVEFMFDGIFEEILDKLGEMPLPPYITEKLEDKKRYQTVYAKNDGSSAAPTAGLHFTEELLELLEKKGVNIARLTLHVGLGTFRPVKVSNILEHKMHSEYFSIDEGNANIINEAKKNGGKIITVGTTSTRTLETIADEFGNVTAKSGYTDIFIYPSYKFKIVDSMITNFHLPESTLIMLISAFSNKEYVMKAYYEAIEKEYRFFSFGDAMFIKQD